MPSVTVVGSANVDIIVRTPHLPKPGETVLAGGFTMSPGGKGANQAVACARLGLPVRFVGRVGRDSFGETLQGMLAEAGVSLDGVVFDDGAPSGVALITVDDAGQNTIAVAQGANGRLEAEDVKRALAGGAGDAVLLQLEIPPEAVEEAARLGAAAGALVVLNPAPARPLPESLLRLVTVLTPNQSELELLTGKPVDSPAEAEDAARSLLAIGVKAVVVTLGGEGCLVVSDEGAVHVPSFDVRVVDTTGAGDAFNAALTVALVEGKPLVEAARFANAAGALATTALGAQEALPGREQVLGLLGRSASRS